MAASRILDSKGNPIELSTLDEELATGSVESVRQVWRESVARGLTPSRLAAILESAALGDADDALTLAEEMEERDPHYAAVIGVRKRAVAGLPFTVESTGQDATSTKISAAVLELTKRPAFSDLVDDLLDGIGKPYSVCEILWQRGAQWWPRVYPHRDPRWFRFDRETGTELRLRSDENPVDGVPLSPFHFIVHRPRTKSGLQIRSGLARLAAFTWLCKAYALKNWLAFVEVFGIPMRLGSYGPSATPEDVRVLKRAVASMGSDAAAVIPEAMKIEFISEKNAGGGAAVFESLCNWLDRQISKAVLGQTMTTDAQSSGLGSNQASVHNEVRGDILASDARALETTLNEQLIRPFIDLNFGPQQQYPRVCLHIAEEEDLQLLADSLGKLVPLGLEVEQDQVRDKFGLREPKKGAKLLGGPSSAAPEDADVAGSGRAGKVATNAAQVAPDDAVAAQVEQVSRESDEEIAAWLSSVRQLLDTVATLEEFRDRLIELHPEMPVGRFSDLMGDALSAAELAGRYDILEQAGLVR